MNTDLEAIDAVLDRFQHGSPEVTFAVSNLRELAEAGDLEAAETLAELIAYPGPYHDAAGAYFWYYIVLSKQGYSTKLVDHNQSPSNYCGSVEDFRNVIRDLDFERALQLDLAAQRWIVQRA